MKTVKDFEDAGLEFVNGDTGGTYQITCEEVFNRSNAWNNDTPTSFAWRTNNGEKPSFIGLIEFTYNGEGCEMQECRPSSNINWSLVKKWRPSLNQQSIKTETPEEKEIFEAMEENKRSATISNPIEPSHYTDLAISPLEYITANEGEFTWCISNVIKYVSRYKRKNGLEDLKKAAWYLNNEIERIERGQTTLAR